LPLAVPSALIAAVWDQVNEGMRAVPSGGAEVGGLLLGRRSQTPIILAEEVVPIAIEYQFGPSFRLSTSDLKGIEALMASLQKDPSKRVVGFYRSRTRNDSLYEENERTVLATLEQAHTSFASDFHYYVALTPTSRLTMTASASFRREEGWDDWQHVTLVMNPRSIVRPFELVPAPTGPQASSSQFEQASATPPAEAPNALRVPDPLPASDRIAPDMPDPAAHVPQPAAEPHPRPRLDREPAEPPAVRTREGSNGARRAWYVAGVVLLAAVALGTYLRINSSPPTVPVTVSETRAATAPASETTLSAATAPASLHTGFVATRDGSLWKLAWDRAAVKALHPTSLMLSIRDGAKKRLVHLAPSDLARGAIFYTPQSNDLLFSLTLVTPGGQSEEEHVRALGGARSVEALLEPGPKIVAPDQVRTLRPFTLTPSGPKDSPAGNQAVAEAPPPPALTAVPNAPLNSVLPIAPATPVQPATVAKPLSSPETSPPPARVDFAKLLAGSWAATFSESPFPTETATVSVTVYAGEVDGWFLGRYRVPKTGPPLKQPVNFQFRGNLDKDRSPDGAWVFTFRSGDRQGNVKLRPQGGALDVTWKASLEDGKTYTFEHVMGRQPGK